MPLNKANAFDLDITPSLISEQKKIAPKGDFLFKGKTGLGCRFGLSKIHSNSAYTHKQEDDAGGETDFFASVISSWFKFKFNGVLPCGHH